MKPTANSPFASTAIFTHNTISATMTFESILGKKSHWMGLLVFTSMILGLGTQQLKAQTCSPDVTPPVANCMDLTVSLDATGNASITGSDLDDGSSDNCTITSITAAPNTFDCTTTGPQFVTVLVSDGTNTDPCLATVTVNDNTPPSVTCQSTVVSLDASGNGVLLAAAVEASSSDNCGVTTSTVSPNSFSCTEVGSPGVTLTVGDAAGNTATCAATVTVQDVTTPDAQCQNATVFLDNAGNLTIDGSELDNGSSDACGAVSFAASTTAFTCANVGNNNVTVTVTDQNTNSATCSAVLNISAVGPPNAICQAAIVVLDGTGNGTVVASSLNNGSTGYCGAAISGFTTTPAAFDCSMLGANTVTLTVTDVNGQTANCAATVDVQDNTAPDLSCVSPNLNLDINGEVTMTPNDAIQSQSDNCGITTYTYSPNSFDCNDVGLNGPITSLTVSDASNNIKQCFFRVNIFDNIPPTMACQHVTLALDISGQASISTGDIDNGSSDACGVTNLSLSTQNFDCDDIGVNTVTLTATDSDNNTASCSASVTVEDNLPPTALCANQTVQLDATGNVTIAASDVDNGSTDNCVGPYGFALSQTAFDCSDTGAQNATQVTLTVTDVAGNTDNCTADITVEDNVAPIAICQAVTVFIDINGNATVAASDVDDNSSDNCDIDNLALSPTAFTCAEVGGNPVTLTVTDVNNNSSSCSGTVTVIDNRLPNANCLSTTVFLDASGNAAILPSDVSAMSDDNCDFTMAVSPNAFDCNDIGINTFTLTVTDASSNSASCSGNVTIEDNLPPTTVCQNITVTLDGTGNVSVAGSDIDGGSTDNCEVASLVAAPAAFTCTNIGTNNVTLTVTDGESNSADCVAIVTVQETQAPNAVCQNLSVFLDATGNVTLAASDVNNGSTDNCGIVSSTVTPNTFDCADIANNPHTVTLTITDGSNNSASCSADAYVADELAPVLVCNDITVTLDPQAGTYTLTTSDISDIATGSSDNCGIQSQAVSPNSFDCTATPSTSVTLTVTDVNNKTADCVATVIVDDNTPPDAICQDVAVQLDASGNGTALASDVNNNSSDICGIQSLAITPSTFDCSQIGSVSVTLTVTDNNNNTSSCTSNAIVQDNINPTAVCQTAIVELDANGNGALAGSDVDGGSSDNCGTLTLDVSPMTFSCLNVSGSNTATLTVTDVGGNTATCIANVVVQDNVDPTPICATGVIVLLDGSGNGSIATSDIDANSSDACGISTTAISPTTFGCNTIGNQPVILAVTDANANTATCTTSVDVQDGISPTAICQGATVSLDANGSATVSAATIDNLSSDNCSLSSLVVSPSTFDCNDLGNVTVTLTVEDPSTNSDDCTAIVVVEDNIDPTAICQSISVDLDANGEVNLAASQVDNGSSDNCAMYSLSVSPNTFECADAGPNNVTLTVTDIANNTATCPATVTIEDNTPPTAICQDATVEVDASGNASIVPSDVDNSSSDNCGITSYAVNPSTFDCSVVGSVTVTLSLADLAGNQSSCTSTVSAQDNRVPIATCQSITVDLDASGNVAIAVSQIDNGSTDNCPGATIAINPTSYACQAVGDNTIILTVTDASSNTTTCSANVRVNDVTLPVALCQAITVQLDNNGAVTLSGSEVDNNSSDACGIATYAVTPNTFDCTSIASPTTVTLRVEDPSSNSASCTTAVSVQDNVVPNALCQDLTVTLDANGDAAVTTSQVNNNSSDACGIASYSLDIDEFDCDDLSNSPIAIVLTVTDVNGNAGNCQANVAVVDNIAPTAVCQDLTIQLDAGGNAAVIASDVDNGSSDICGIFALDVIPTSFGCNDILSSPNTVTLTVTDNNNNTASCSAAITIEDNIDPTPICQTHTVTLDASGNGSLVVADVDGGSSDNCSVSVSVSPTTFDCDDAIGPAGAVLTATDPSGNQSTCTALVIVSDVTPPTAICQDITVALDASGQATVASSDVDNGSSDVCGLVSALSTAAYSFDQNVTPEIIFGSGNANGGFTTNSSGTVELGLRAKQRFPAANIFNSNGDGTYSFNTGNGSSANPNDPEWAFEWSINTDQAGSSGDKLDDYTYELGIDFDKGDGRYFLRFDLINSPSPVPDHAIGTNVTANGGGTNTNDSLTYAGLIANNNVAQNSWRMSFFDNGPFSIFDPNDDGRYDFHLIAYDGSGSEVARTSMSVLVGNVTNNNVVTSFDCNSLASNPANVVLTVTDQSGNTSDCTADVTIVDNTPPTAICQAQTVTLDASGNGSLVASDVDDGSSDNCSVSLAASPTTFDCDDLSGTVGVVLTVTDPSGNTAVCTATVTVEDNTLPIATCQDITVQLDANGDVSIVASQVDNGSSDACGTVSLSATPTTFDCSSIAGNPNTVTLTVTDGSNNTAACTAAVTVEDVTAPDAICQDLTVNLDASGNASIVASQINNGSSDACGIATLSINSTTFDCSTTGANPVTLTVTDKNNNTADCTATVTVVDNIVPVVNCLAISVQLDGNGQASLVPSDLVANLIENCPNPTLSASQVQFDCSNIGSAVVVTLTVTDASNNTATCSANVTVQDLLPPTAICQAITVQLDVNGQASIAGSELDGGSTDNCVTLTYSANPSTFDCNTTGSNNVTLTVTDGSGLTADCVTTVFVEDLTAPTASCQDITINLDASGNASIVASQIDNGSSDNCSVQSIAANPTTFDCSNAGNNPVVLTVTDAFGNTANCTATVHVDDVTAPTAICQDITVQLDANGDASITAAQVDNNSSDACGIASLSLNPTTFDCTAIGNNPNTVTLTVTDVNGNTSDCTANAVVEDNVDPTAICIAYTVQLDGNGQASITGSDINSGSSDACGIANLSANPSTFDCADIGSNNNVTLTVTDANGNTATCASQVTVEDNIAPDAICQDITVQLDANGTVSIVASQVDNGSSDNCTVQSVTVSPTGFSCQTLGANPVTLTVTDQSNNTADCTANVTVEDNTLPTALCQDITVQLDANGDVSITAAQIDNGSSDACGTVTLSATPTTFDCNNTGSNTVTLTVTDGSNNTAACTAAVTVEDVTAPDAICQDLTVNLDASGNASIVASQIDNGSSDACGIATTTVNPTTFDCSTTGANTVTLTVTDNNNNTADCTATVTVVDNISPVVNCLAISVQLDGNGSVSIAPSDLVVSLTENCPDPVLTASQTQFSCSDLANSPIAVTLTVTDASGNTTTCSANVTVEDLLAPTAICQPITVQLDGNGQASIAGSEIDGGSTDNCVTLTYSANPSTFDCSNLGANTVTLTVTDGSALTADCTAQVTVEDLVPPVALCQDITIQLDASGNVSIAASDVDGGSSDNCSTVSLGVAPSTFTCQHVGNNNTVVLTVTDGGGNTADCSATVTVEDNVAPTAICNSLTVTLDANGLASLTGSDIGANSSDNCSVASLSASVSSFGCSDVGSNTVLLTVTDGSNNTATCNAQVTVVDNLAPTALCQAATLELDASGNVSLATSDVDAGSTDNCAIQTYSVTPSAFDCNDIGTQAVTLTITDVNGNSADCTTTVEIEDNLAPNAVCQDITVQLDANGLVSLAGSDVDGGSSDNCGITSISVGPSTFDCSTNGTVTVFVFVSDASSNQSSCTANVTIEDNTNPTAGCQPVTIQLDATGNANIVASDVESGSSDNCFITIYSVSPNLFDCSHVGSSNSVVLTVTDFAGNTGSCNATVTVEDNVPPTAICQDVTVNLDANGMASITASQVDNGSSDACGIASLSVAPTQFDCSGVSQTTAVLTVTDVNNNTASCQATVFVNDQIAPVAFCQDITVQLDATGSASIDGSDIDNGSSDACAIASLSASLVQFDCSNIGGNAVTLTVTDANGNTADCSATVTVEDNLAPTMVCQSASVDLDINGFASIAASDVDGGTTDNCGIATTTVSPNTFDCSNVNSNTVTLTATDVNGNSASCTANVTVSDVTPPTALCQDITVQLDANGNASITASQIDNGSSDACGVSGISAAPTAFSCQTVGPNAVTLTVTDINNNTADCTATVTVEDNVTPVALCQDITVQLDVNGLASISGSSVDNGSSDGCGVASLSVTPSNFACGDVGPNGIILTVTDVNGNTALCTATATVEDNVAPDAICENITIQLSASGQASIVTSDVDNGSADACGITSLSLNTTAFDCSNLGTNTVVLTVTDVNSNTASCSATVNVEDVTPPIALCQDLTIQIDANGLASIAVSDIDNGSSDVCGVVSLSASPVDFDCNTVGTNIVTLTVTDGSQNTADCTATVTVEDLVAPVALCQSISVNLTANSTRTITGADVDNGSSDNCGVVSLDVSPNTFDCSSIGLNTVVLTVTDNYSNTATCTAFVIVAEIVPTASSTGIIVCNEVQLNIDLQDIVNTTGNGATAAFTWFAQNAPGVNGESTSSVSGAFINDSLSLITSQTIRTVRYVVTPFSVPGNCQGASFFVDVTIRPNPDVIINVTSNGGSTNVCSGDQRLMQGILSTSPYSPPTPHIYTWSIIQETGTSVGLLDGTSGPFVGPNVGFSGTGAGTVSVELALTDNTGCIGRDTVVFTILSGPTPMIVGADSVCSGATEKYGTVIPVVGNSYRWILNGGGGFSTANLRDSIDVLWGNIPGGPHELILLEIDANGCFAYDTLLVTIAPNLVLNPIANLSLVCPGDTLGPISLTTVPSSPTTVFTWTTSGSAYLGLADGSDTASVGMIPKFAALNHTNAIQTNIVTVTADLNGCNAATQTFSFSVNIAPRLGTPDTARICVGDSYDLSTVTLVDTNSFSGTVTYHTGLPATIANQLTNTVVSPTTTTTYYILKTTTGCDGVLAFDVNVSQPVAPTFSNPQLLVCENTLGLTYTLNQTFASYDWFITNATIAGGGGTTDNFVTLDFGTQDATIKIIGTDASGCFDSTEITIDVVLAPIALITGLDSMYCPNEGAVTLTGSPIATGSSATSTFSISSPGVITDNGNGTASFDPSLQGVTAGTGVFYITYTYDDGTTCNASITARVQVKDDTVPTALCKAASVLLDANGQASIAASDIDNGSSDDCASSVSLSVSPMTFDCQNLGANTVTLTVDDGFGNQANCTATVTVTETTAPVALCQDITVQLDANGIATVIASDVDAGSSDNCGTLSIGVSPSTFNCSDLGQQQVTLAVFDPSLNVNSCTAFVTVEDNLSPTALCQDMTISLDAIGQASLVASDVDNNSSDNCGVASISASPTNFSCADLGANTVVLTVTDVNNLTTSCAAIVTVQDNILPVIVCPADINEMLTQNCDSAITWAAPVATDNCGVPTITGNFTSGATFPTGTTTVTYDAVDGSLNSASCSFTITLTEGGLPTAICQDVTVQLDASGNVSVAASTVDGGSSDNCSPVAVTVSRTIGQGHGPTAAFDCSDITTPVTVELLVADSSGNTATCTALVTVEDVTPPTANCLGALTINLDPQGLATLAVSDVDNGSSDACGIVSSSIDKTNFTTADVGSPSVVTLTVTDASGNSATCTTLVTVGDNTPPVAVCVSQLTVQLDANGQASIVVSDVDAGSSDDNGIASITVSPNTFDCNDLGIPVTVTLLVTDFGGNQDDCQTVVTVLDTISPTVTCNSITVSLDANGQASITSSDVVSSSSDNCAVTSLSVAPTTFDCSDVGSTISVAVTAYDASQNDGSCTAFVTVIDTRGPTAICSNVTVALNGAGLASIAASDVDGGSGTPCGGPVSLTVSPNSFDCTHVGQTNTVTLTVTDGQGNSADCTATVTVEDTSAPTVFCNGSAILNLSGSQVTLDLANAIAFTSDNCEVVDTTASQTVFGCQDVGALNQVVVTVTDASANTTTCVVTILVFDISSPVAVCAASTVSIDANGTATVAGSDVDGGSTDNCGIVSRIVSPNTFGCADVGTPVSVILTVTDAAGLTASCSTLVTIEDVTPPTAVCQTVTAMLDANGWAVITENMVDGGSSDNCGITTITIDQDSFQCNQFGANIVTLTVSDVAGNTSSCSANVTIQDSLPPTPACVTSVSVALGPNGQVFVPVSLVNAGSFDNCSLASVSLAPQNFTCADVGNNQVTLTAIDASGNSNFCIGTVEVQDNIPPQALCQDVTITLDASGTAVLAASDVDAGSLDLCDLDLIVSPDTFTCADLGVNQVVLIVSDPGGNQDACTANVTVLSPVAMPIATIFTPDTTICSADTFTIRANTPAGLSGGQWTVPVGVTIFPNNSSPIITVIGVTANTVEEFVWTVTEGCFTASDTVDVTVNESPFVLAFETNPISVFGGSDGEATAVVLTIPAIASYNWSDGQTTGIATNLSAGTYTVFVVDVNGCVSNTDTVTFLNPPATGLNVNVKAMLEGPYNVTSTLMDDNLRVFRYIPETDPYFGTYTVDTTLFQTTGNDAIVDWVCVRLRDASDSTIIVDSVAALIQRDGDIVAVDNSSPINFVNAAPGDYYIEVKHRNHLAIMSDTSITLPGPAVGVDFFNGTTPAFGPNAMNSITSPGKFLMYGGDADGNGLVQSNDIFLEWLPARGLAGYYNGDMDMNGLVQSNDIFLIWLANRGFMTQVPN